MSYSVLRNFTKSIAGQTDFLMSLNLCIGFALCCRVVSDLYHAYFGGLARSVTEFQTWAVVRFILVPMGWEAAFVKNTIAMPGGQVQVVFECMAPEILCFLTVLVFLLSKNRRDIMYGIFLCPFLFLVINSVRMAFMAIVNSCYPRLFHMFHGTFFDLVLLAFAGFCLWLWLGIKSFGGGGECGKRYRWYGITRVFISIVLFYIGALVLESYVKPWYQDRLFYAVSRVLSADDFKAPLTCIPNLFNFIHVSFLLAIIWCLRGTGFRAKSAAIFFIFLVRFGCDFYICHSFVSSYHIRTSTVYNIQVISNDTRIVFQTISAAVTVVLSVYSLMKRHKNKTIEKVKEQERGNRASSDNVTFVPQTLIIALFPFIITQSVTVEEALFIDTFCTVAWLVLPWFLEKRQRSTRLLAGVGAVCFAFFCRGFMIDAYTCERQACYYVLQQEYDKALLPLSRAISVTHRENSRLYLERGLIYLILEDSSRAKSDIETALKTGAEIEKSYSCMALWNHVAGVEKKLVTEILRAGVFDIFSEKVKKSWKKEHDAIEKTRLEKEKNHYKQRLTLNPSDHLAHWHHGLICFMQGSLFQALENFDRVISIDVSFHICRYYRAKVYFKHRRYKEAQDDLSIYILKNPKDAMAYYQRAEIYRIQRYYYKALNDYIKLFLSVRSFQNKF